MNLTESCFWRLSSSQDKRDHLDWRVFLNTKLNSAETVSLVANPSRPVLTQILLNYEGEKKEGNQTVKWGDSYRNDDKQDSPRWDGLYSFTFLRSSCSLLLVYVGRPQPWIPLWERPEDSSPWTKEKIPWKSLSCSRRTSIENFVTFRAAFG